MKKAFALFATILLFSFTTYAQSSASASASVNASIAKGLAITNVGGSSIDFGEIIATTSTQNPVKLPGSGANFEVTGHPGKNVTITFSDVNLDNGGTESMAFHPTVEQTGGDNNYTGTATKVTSGSSLGLVNNSGTGYLYLWMGGTLDVAADQASGPYGGTATVQVDYLP